MRKELQDKELQDKAKPFNLDIKKIRADARKHVEDGAKTASY